MARYRTEEEINHYDRFKLLILLLLLALLAVLLIFGEQLGLDNNSVTGVPGRGDVIAEATMAPVATEAATGETAVDLEGSETTPDILPETGPVLVSPQPGADVEAGDVVLSGRAEPGTTVIVYVDDQEAGETAADETGTWMLAVPLRPGMPDISVQTLDESGAVLGQGGPFTLNVAGTGEPTINPPEITEDGDTPVLSGTAAPGTRVEVVVDGQPIGVAEVDEQGNWTFTPNLEPGSYVLELIPLDESGNRLPGTGPVEIDVPSEAVPDIEEPDTGWTTGPNTITGEAQPGATIRLLVNGVEVATATADSEGEWTVNVNLPEGETTLSAVTTDAEGQEVVQTITIETGAGEPATSIAETAQAAGQFATLLTAAEAAGLAETLTIGGPFTVFAPPDTAFAALPTGTLEAWLANPQALSAVLLHHIVPGTFSANEAVVAGTLNTAQGDQVNLRMSEGAVLVDNAAVITPDVTAQNGVIHIIDRVLLPSLPAGVAPPVIDSSGVPTFVGPVLTVVGTAQPGTTILLQLNGENFGQLAGVDANGNWSVSGNVTSGQYEIIAYMYDPVTGVLLAVSEPVLLNVP